MQRAIDSGGEEVYEEDCEDDDEEGEVNIDEDALPFSPDHELASLSWSQLPSTGQQETTSEGDALPSPWAKLEEAQTLSPHKSARDDFRSAGDDFRSPTSEIKRGAREIFENAAKDGHLKEALQQIPKSANSAKKDQACRAGAMDVKQYVWEVLLRAAQNGLLQKVLSEVQEEQNSVIRVGDVKRQAQAMPLQAAQNGHPQKALAQMPQGTYSEAQKEQAFVAKEQASVARAVDIKCQAQAVPLQGAQNGHLQKAPAQIPERTCVEAPLARSPGIRTQARALLNKVFLAVASAVSFAPEEAAAESSHEACSERAPPADIGSPAQDEVAAESFQEVVEELVPPIATSAQDEVAATSSQHTFAELVPEMTPLEGHFETIFSEPHQPSGPPPTVRRLQPARKVCNPDAELEDDRHRLRSKHLDNLQQQRLRNPHAQVTVQGSQEASMSSQHNLSMSSELGQEWYQDHMLEHFQRRRHLRGPGAAAVFGPSQPNPHKIPRATSRPTKQHSPAAVPSPFLAKPPAKQRDNGKRSQVRPQPPGFKRAGMPQFHRSVEAPLKEGEHEAFPDFSQDVDVKGVAALCGVYTSLVCRRPPEDKCLQFAQNSTELAMPSIMSTELKQNQSLSEQPSTSLRAGMSMEEPNNFSRCLPPGLAAFASRDNPWHWPRNGGVPPMDVAVVALLDGQPPPTKVSPEQTLAARQALRLPVVRKARDVPKWPDSAAQSSPRKPPERPYWLRGAGRKASPGLK